MTTCRARWHERPRAAMRRCQRQEMGRLAFGGLLMIHFKGSRLWEAAGPHPLTVECPIPDYATYRDNDLVLVMFVVDSPYRGQIR